MKQECGVFGSRKRNPGKEIGKRLLTTAGLNGEKMIKLGSPGLCQRVKAMEEKSAASKDMGMEAP
jgi:hypothetical protein